MPSASTHARTVSRTAPRTPPSEQAPPATEHRHVAAQNGPVSSTRPYGPVERDPGVGERLPRTLHRGLGLFRCRRIARQLQRRSPRRPHSRGCSSTSGYATARSRCRRSPSGRRTFLEPSSSAAAHSSSVIGDSSRRNHRVSSSPVPCQQPSTRGRELRTCRGSGRGRLRCRTPASWSASARIRTRRSRGSRTSAGRLRSRCPSATSGRMSARRADRRFRGTRDGGVRGQRCRECLPESPGLRELAARCRTPRFRKRQLE